MPRKQNNIHYIYRTTCNVTEKYYIGMHSTSNLEDGYMGSGKKLRHSIRKYGKENHTKEILEFFDTREELVEAEKRVITEEHLKNALCMNLMSGGTGGFISVEYAKAAGKLGGAAYARKLNEDVKFREKYLDRAKNVRIKYITSGKHNFKTFLNKSHTDETKRLISIANKNKGIGNQNSQYGTCWITNNNVNKKIKLNELSHYLMSGWMRGRK